jgi:hypothetical protein
MSFKMRPGGPLPEKKAEIVDAARQVLESARSLYMFTPPNRVGMAQFFGIYRKKLHIIKTINEGGFQPFERHADRTLAIAIAGAGDGRKRTHESRNQVARVGRGTWRAMPRRQDVGRVYARGS